MLKISRMKRVTMKNVYLWLSSQPFSLVLKRRDLLVHVVELLLGPSVDAKAATQGSVRSYRHQI